MSDEWKDSLAGSRASWRGYAKYEMNIYSKPR